jgi:rhodanese-related sulfurtransferase
LRLSKDARLASLNIPHLPMVIEEAFAVLCWQSGSRNEDVHQWTVADLADRAHMPVEGVVKRLEQIATMAEDMEISAPALHDLLQKNPERVFLLDVREPWEFEICRVPGSHLMARTDLAKIFEGLKELTVVTICHHGARSLSAAFYLREAGLRRVKSLRGGVESWATQVEPSMIRY